jgi:hypothetical protein
MITIALDEIRTDGGTQPRVSTNEAAIAEYVEFIRAGGDMPAITVFDDGADKWLADGFHRFHAYRTAGATGIECHVIGGTKRDAILYSVGANTAHGLRRTNEDKRKAVTTLLNDAEWAKWSDNAIAKACGVSQPYVSGIREPSYNGSKIETARTVERNGKTYEQNTANIGKVKNTPSSSHMAAPEVVMADELPDEINPVAELQDSLKETLADNEMMGRVFDSDDRVKAAMDEAVRQKAIADNAERKFNAQQSKVVALAKQVTYWQNRAEKAEKLLGKVAA